MSIFYGERLSRVQKIATARAGVGVANELYRTGGFSWLTCGPIWPAVLALILEGMKHLNRLRRSL